MILIALMIGAVLIIAAFRNSQAALFTAIGTDGPGFVVWAAAILAVGAVGYVPGLKPISRGLLALILLVIILKNYETILAGLQSANASAAQASVTNASAATDAGSSGSSQVNSSTISPAMLSDFASAFGSNMSAA